MSTPNLNRIGGTQTVTATTTEPATGTHTAHKPRLSLFNDSTFGQQVGSTTLPGGVVLPTFGQDAGKEAQAFLDGLSDDGRQAVQSATQNLTAAVWQEVGVTPHYQASTAAAAAAGTTHAAGSADASSGGTANVPGAQGVSRVAASIQTPGVYTNPNSGLTQAAANAVATYQNASGSDYDVSVTATLYNGLDGLQSDLANYAQVVQGQINLGNTARSQLAEIRDTVNNWPQGQNTVAFTWTEFDQNGQPQTKTGNLTKDQASAKADDLQNVVSQLGQQTQVQQLQLQQYTNNYQNGINELSNVLKFQYDTVKSIINNIKVS